MKKILFLTLTLLSLKSFTQDIIIKKNGDEIKTKVVEIADLSIKYKKWENVDGPIYNITKAEVFKVKYANGESDFFGNIPVSNTSNNTPATTVTQTATSANKTSAVVVSEQKNNPPVAEKSKPSDKKGANKEVITNYPQPADDNVPYYYDQETNTLKELDKTNYTTENRRKGAWGKEEIVILPGSLSNAQFSKKQGNTFIIHFDKSDAEPYSSCVLNTPEINDNLKQREWVQSTKGAHGTQQQHDDVVINFKKIGTGLYLITLDKKVKLGELFFMIPSTKQIYAFGYNK